MAISLSKGGTISLTKEAGAAGLARVHVGLGWDQGSGKKFDLDASALMLGASGRPFDDSDFVFYNLARDPDGCIRHPSGGVTLGPDNRSGEGDGDDEWIEVDVTRLPAGRETVVFLVSIDGGLQSGLSFGQVDSAFIRVENLADGRELARFDLTEGASTDSAMVFGELYRDGAEWKFRAVGDGYPGLAEILAHFGLDAS